MAGGGWGRGRRIIAIPDISIQVGQSVGRSVRLIALKPDIMAYKGRQGVIPRFEKKLEHEDNALITEVHVRLSAEVAEAVDITKPLDDGVYAETGF